MLLSLAREIASIKVLIEVLPERVSLGGVLPPQLLVSFTLVELVAILMTLMELVVINVGYDLGVIPPNVFAMLVLMAIFSTVITAPVLRIGLRKLGWKYELRPDV